MNKLLTKVAKLALGLSLAAGVGVAIGSKSTQRADAANEVWASTSETFELASSISAGDEIVIVSTYADNAMGSQGTNNRTTGAITKNTSVTPNTVVANSNNTVAVFTVAVSTENSSYWTFFDGSGYLYDASTSSKNYLRTQSTVTSNGYSDWSVSISNGVASITARSASATNKLTLSYNTSGLFACYAALQSNGGLAIYKKVQATTTATQTTVTAAGDKTSLDVTADPADTVQLSASITYNNGTSTVQNASVTWSGNNNAVATIDNSGLVTAVGVGSARFTASYSGDSTYSASNGYLDIVVSNPNEAVFDFATLATLNSWINGTAYTPVVVNGVTLSTESGGNNAKYYTSDHSWRMYNGGSLTITPPNGKAILSITSTPSYTFEIEDDGSSATASFTATTNFTNITVTLGNPPTPKTVVAWTITGSIGETVKNTAYDLSGLTLHAWYDLEKTDEASSSIANRYVLVANPTTAGGSANASNTIDVEVYLATDTGHTNLLETFEDVDAPIIAGAHGSEDNPYTIVEAKAAIDAGTGLTDVYVKGIISQIDSYSSTYKSITYWISDDGTTTNQFEIYSGKGLNGADFTGVEDIALKASVVVYGTIKKYNEVYEMDKNNQLVEYTPLADPFVDFPFEYRNILVGLSKTALPESDNLGGNTISYSSSNTSVATVNGSGQITGVAVGSATITASVTVDQVLYSDTYTLYVKSSAYSVTEARTYIDGGTNLNDQYVTGYISRVTSNSVENNGGLTYWISVNGAETNEIEVFKGKDVGGADFTSVSDLSAGDLVVVCGDLTLYQSTTYEFASGSHLVSKTSGALSSCTISYESNGGSGTMSNTTGVSPLVAECEFTAPEGYQFASWNTLANGSGVTYDVGDSVNDDITLYAIWEPIPVAPTEYFTQITSTSEITDGKYLIAYGDVIFDGSRETLDAASNNVSMNLANLLTSYFTIDTNDGSIQSASGLYIGRSADSNGLDSSATVKSNTISFDENGNIDIVGAGGAHLRYNSASSDLRFRYYKSSSYTSQKAIQLYKVNFSKVMLSGVTCNESGTSQPTGESWSNLEAYYNTLSTTEKATFASATANENGTDLQKAMAKYDYIVGKYNPTNSSSSAYKNFIGRTVTPIGGQNFLLNTVIGENTNTIAIIVIISMVSVTAIGGYFFIKRRKVN